MSPVGPTGQQQITHVRWTDGRMLVLVFTSFICAFLLFFFCLLEITITNRCQEPLECVGRLVGDAGLLHGSNISSNYRDLP